MSTHESATTEVNDMSTPGSIEDESSADYTSKSDGEKIETRVGWRYTLREITRDTTAKFGLVIISIVLFVALFTSIDHWLNYTFAERFLYHPERPVEGAQPLLPPVGIESNTGTGVWAHPLGTDHHGRDLAVRVLYGTRVAVQAGVVATAIGMIAGTIIGAVAGYYGDLVDDLLMRFVEILFAIPFLIMAIAFMVVFGRTLIFAMIGVAITSIPIFARLIRSRVVSVREEEYIEAAKAAGLRDRVIILKYVIPNSFAPVLVQATLQMGVNILIIAGLSFLGFGAQPPTPSWGQMLANARIYMLPNIWFSIWPGLAILFTVIGFNVFGDGLRDALDPRLQN